MTDVIMALFGFLTNIIIKTVMLHISVKITKVEEATLYKAFVIATVTAIFTTFIGFITGWAGIISLILTMPVIRLVYAIVWSKAMVVWMLYFVIGITVGIILPLLGLRVLIAA